MRSYFADKGEIRPAIMYGRTFIISLPGTILYITKEIKVPPAGEPGKGIKHVDTYFFNHTFLGSLEDSDPGNKIYMGDL